MTGRERIEQAYADVLAVADVAAGSAERMRVEFGWMLDRYATEVRRSTQEEDETLMKDPDA